MEVCASCSQFDIKHFITSKDSMKPNWLLKTDYVKEFITRQTSFKNIYPDKYNVKTLLGLDKKYFGRKVLFWAAKEKSGNELTVKNAKEAYGNFKNSGVASINKSGEAILRFACPQVYSTTPVNKESPQTYYRHLHFVISNETKDKWEPQIYTKIVICKFSIEKSMKMLKTGNFIFINALPCEYYGKDHIPNTYNLTHTQVKKMSKQNVVEWFEQIIKLHYPNIHLALKTKKININEVPIISYCAHEKCNAAELLLEELMKKGMVNVNEYSGGMKNYRKLFS